MPICYFAAVRCSVQSTRCGALSTNRCSNIQHNKRLQMSADVWTSCRLILSDEFKMNSDTVCAQIITYVCFWMPEQSRHMFCWMLTMPHAYTPHTHAQCNGVDCVLHIICELSRYSLENLYAKSQQQRIPHVLSWKNTRNKYIGKYWTNAAKSFVKSHARNSHPMVNGASSDCSDETAKD